MRKQLMTPDVNVSQEEFLQELVADLQRKNAMLEQSLLIANIRNRKLTEALEALGVDSAEEEAVEPVVEGDE